MNSHDAIYHRIFSHPGMVAQLLREFVGEPWAGDLDFDAIDRISAKFHAESGVQRDGDMVWRIPLRTGGEAYLLLLLEFQSTSDRWMALRLLVYAGLLWQHLAKENRLAPDGRLPPVFPLVLYNGGPRWAAPLDMASLIALPPGSPLWHWQPAMGYHLVDEGAYSNADLKSRDTLAALLFRLENAPGPSEIEAAVDAVIDWFRRHDGFEALKPLFAALAYRAIATVEGLPPRVRVSENLLEVKTMLSERPAQWKAQWTQEGRRDGVAGVLLRQMERRFGSVPDAVRSRIAEADSDDLEAWSLRILDAATIDEVLH
jgi:hypothetical protein